MITSVSWVTAGVTFGLPSRSPPIHEPKESKAGIVIPDRDRVVDRLFKIAINQRDVCTIVERKWIAPRAASSSTVGLTARTSLLPQSSAIVAPAGAARASSLQRKRPAFVEITQHLKDSACLSIDGPAARLGRVSGEHEPDRRLTEHLCSSGGGDATVTQDQDRFADRASSRRRRFSAPRLRMRRIRSLSSHRLIN